MSPVIKKKGEKFTIPSKYLLFVLTCLCTVLMALTFSTDIFNRPLNAAVGYVVVPFEQGISKVGSWLSGRKDELAQIRQLLDENVRLQQQVDELLVENTLLQQEKAELSRLRELYQLDSQYDEYHKVGARIIARDSGNWYSAFQIDKGADDGLEINMNVIAGGGLVGRISEVGPNWARVTSIIADNSNVSAKTLSTSDTMIVSGDLQAMHDGVICFSQLIDSQDNVAVGDKVVTSHISDRYLPNILIGTVHTINRDSNNLTKSGFVTPAVDFEHLEEVLVITDMKREIEDA
ncbi:MAG: rod shape-determining protein MreC [Lachnospiraceae bacterium]|nr:rod shape-determining protein MreC [Lachnospiraceae bacterium]